MLCIIKVSSLSKESVMVNVVLELHVHIHILLIVKLLVHSSTVNVFNVKSSPFAVAVTAPLVSFASVSYFWDIFLAYFDGWECSDCSITHSQWVARPISRIFMIVLIWGKLLRGMDLSGISRLLCLARTFIIF